MKDNKTKIKETFYASLMILGSLITLVFLGLIVVFILKEGFPQMAKYGVGNFISGDSWKPEANIFGIKAFVLGTVYSTLGAILIGGPIGILTAVYITNYAKEKFKSFAKVAVNVLASVPSVVFGFFGLIVLVQFMAKDFMTKLTGQSGGNSLFVVIIILSIMILPTVIVVTCNALEEVNKSFKEASFGLGASKAQTVFKIILPSVKSGVFAAIVLGVGRALGETMAVLLVAGNSTKVPEGIFSKIRTLSGNIALEMGYAQGDHKAMLFATGVILFLLIFIFNLLFYINKLRRSKYERDLNKDNRFFRNLSVDAKILTFTKDKDNGIKIILRKILFIPLIVFSLLALVFDKVAIVLRKILDFLVSIIKRILSKIKSLIGKVIPLDKMSNAGEKLGLTILTGLVYISMFLTFLSLLIIVTFIFKNGLPAFNLDFFQKIYPSIISTLMIVAIGIAIAIPIGIATSIYLCEYNRHKKLKEVINFAIDSLAGIPSILYGLFGLIFFVTYLNIGFSILSGGLTVAILILPTVIRVTVEALNAVPLNYREGSYALGAPKYKTINKVVLKSARNGIISAVILAVGRIVGETAAIYLPAGTNPKVPGGIFDSGRTLAVNMYMVAKEAHGENQFSFAFGNATVLILIMLFLVLLSEFLIRRSK